MENEPTALQEPPIDSNLKLKNSLDILLARLKIVRDMSDTKDPHVLSSQEAAAIKMPVETVDEYYSLQKQTEMLPESFDEWIVKRINQFQFNVDDGGVKASHCL